MFDGLFAIAIDDVNLNKTYSINDKKFNNRISLFAPEGGFFKTGKNWDYIWTRDISYAAHLALSYFDYTYYNNEGGESGINNRANIAVMKLYFME